MIEIQRIGVIGAGTMGAGIVQVAANCDFPVTVVDIDEKQIQKMLALIRKNCDFLINKAKTMSVLEKNRLFGNITTSTNISNLADCDLIVEAATEKPELKEQVFSQLAKICRKEAILASNTSAVDISRMAAKVKNPGKVIGMHFMNPVPRMRLVEIVRTKETSDETVKTVVELAIKLGKVPVVVGNHPGFVANYLLMVQLNKAFDLLQRGIASIEGIDTVMELGLSHPMGSFKLTDLIGNDTTLSILDVIYHDTGDEAYKPHPLLEKMVKAEYLGNKTPKVGGFYLNGKPNQAVYEFLQ